MMPWIWLLFCNQRVVCEFGGQTCQDRRVGVTAFCYLELRQLDALNLDLSLVREALRVGRSQVDYAADHRDGLMRQPTDAEPTHLDQAGERVRCACQQLSVAGLEPKPVVANEARKRQESALRRRDEPEREQRFAGAGGTSDEKRTCSNEHRAGMHGGPLRHQAAGSRTVKRAPSTFDGSEPCVPMRFSAHRRPSCASAICLEIDRPRPEFWPKSWCGR